VSGREPDVVAGKPGPVMVLEAAGRDRQQALVVGDRLDTDIAGAAAADLDSLLVLTGVTGVAALLRAAPHERPTYLSRDLGGLTKAHPGVDHDGEGAWACGSARVSDASGRLTVLAPGEPDDVLRALCAASWRRADTGRPVEVAADALSLAEG
jgi:hypothetical protein